MSRKSKHSQRQRRIYQQLATPKRYDIGAPGPKPPSPWPVIWAIVGMFTFCVLFI